MIEDPRPLTAGVCGHPIGQSKSPLLFRHWFDVYSVPGVYAPYLIAPDDFERCIRALAVAGLRGINCTLPHKQSALALADAVSPSAKAIGAANTLTFGADGTIHADNTDGFGFLENLRQGAPGWKASDGPAVVLGAGGAARAAIHVLLEDGCPEVRLTNRTLATAEALADLFGKRVTVIPWDVRNDAMDGAATIANSTSLGMVGQPPLEVSLSAAPPGAVVTDMVYNPLVTELLQAGIDKGLRTVDGLGMLLHQARPGFRAWFGKDPAVTPALRSACLGVGG